MSRTLADQLRGWPDHRLAALLTERPDLLAPAPQDSAQLASRAGTRASVLRALDRLNRLELTVLDACTVLGGRASEAQVQAVVHASQEQVATALQHLHTLVLIWGPDEELRVLSAVSEIVGTTISGLGPPLEQLLSGAGPERVAGLVVDVGAKSTGDRAADVALLATRLRDPELVQLLAGQCDEAARTMLDHLDATGSAGVSTHAGAPVRASAARTPVEQLTARGLLMAREGRHLVVPRQVGLALRGGLTTRAPVGAPPDVVTSSRQARLVDRAAAGAAHELVHRVELLADHWGEHPVGVLRQGGLGVRDLKATAALLHCTVPVAALVVEIARAAGLVAEGTGEDGQAVWLPTTDVDPWRASGGARQWVRLAGAWLALHRSPMLVADAGRGATTLGPDGDQPWLADLRRATLAVIAELPPGQVLAAGGGVPSLVEHLHWLRPRLPAAQGPAVAAAVEEAAAAGLVGLGGLATHARTLLEAGPDLAVERLGDLLPPPVDHVLLQGDLTAVAPGPLAHDLARDLATVADVESRGGATVYRFTEASVRRAFDHGWSRDEVTDMITRAARTEMPQALSYLIADVARTHGSVRLGAAAAFLRSDDEAALTGLLHDPRASGLGLRRIAPTVLVSQEPAEELLPRLRELGLAPVVEGPDGVVRLSMARAHRAPAPRQAAATARAAAHTTARVGATVTAVRAGDRASSGGPSASARRRSPAEVLAFLREAVEAETTVCIGYVDDAGSTQERVVDPRRVEGGQLRAYDHRSDDVRSFSVHRISTVRGL